MSEKSLKVPSNGAPLHVPPTESLWREMLRLQSQWFIHLFISVGVPKTEPSHEMRGKHIVTAHGDPRCRKACIKWGAAWFLKRIFNDTAITTPVPCGFSTIPSPDHPPFLGRPEPRSPACAVVAHNRVYSPHLLPLPTCPRVV